MTSHLHLTRGYVAIVDDEDHEALSRWSWTYVPSSSAIGSGYAARWVRTPDGSKRALYLHRHLLNASPDQVVDHINGNGLDNRRANLRLATQAQNRANERNVRGGTSPYRGVRWDVSRQRWHASIKSCGRTCWLGTFLDPVAAALAYDQAARARFGEFARPNFPLDCPPEVLVAARASHPALTPADGHLRGVDHPNSRLTHAQVAELRRMRAEGATLQALSAMFGIAPQTAQRIVRGERYRDREEAR